jgi:hypothetical protein
MFHNFFIKGALVSTLLIAAVTGKCHGDHEAKLQAQLDAKTIELDNMKKQVENTNKVVTQVEEKKEKQIVIVTKAKEVVQHEIKYVNTDCSITDDTISVLNNVRKANTNK